MSSDEAAPANGLAALLQIGQKVGNYRVVRQLGQGGMGAVFEAVHNFIGRRAAIKVLHATLSRDPQFASRFLNEARAVNLIKDAGLVEIFEFGILEDGTAYTIMEFLEGETLSQLLRRKQLEGSPRLGNEALEICRQIARAMIAVHQKGIVHRDLKPGNIMLVPDPERPYGLRVKVLDFGIAKLTGLPNEKGQTETGAMIGTPAYMAPEQCIAAPNVDGKADVYALGTLFYEMLAGQLPFDAKHGFDFMAAHVRLAPRPLRTVVPTLPEELAELIHAMLAKDPAERPSMDTVQATIEKIQSGLALKATPAVSLNTGSRRIASSIALDATVSGIPGLNRDAAQKESELGATGLGAQQGGARPSRELLRGTPPNRELPGATPPSQEGLPAVTPVSVTPLPDVLTERGPAPVQSAPRPRGQRLGWFILVAVLLVLGLRWIARSAAPNQPHTPARPSVENPALRTVKWNIISVPSGAEVVRADGSVVGYTPWEIERPAGPGETTITLRYAGYQDQSLLLSYNTDVRTEVRMKEAHPAAEVSRPEPSLEAPSKTEKAGRVERSHKARAGHGEKPPADHDTDVKLLLD
jgi:serine/threonine-protein kinase